jgi:hypothetical protein
MVTGNVLTKTASNGTSLLSLKFLPLLQVKRQRQRLTFGFVLRKAAARRDSTVGHRVTKSRTAIYGYFCLFSPALQPSAGYGLVFHEVS